MTDINKLKPWQFQKGKSGNPAGRPKKPVSPDADLEDFDIETISAESLKMLRGRMRRGSEKAAALLLEHSQTDQTPAQIILYLPLSGRTVDQPVGKIIPDCYVAETDCSVHPNDQTFEAPINIEEAWKAAAEFKEQNK